MSTSDEMDTDLVIEWLNYKKIPFFRLNDEDLMNGNTSISYDLNNKVLIENSFAKISIQDVKIIWFRKFGFLDDYSEKIGRNTDLMRYIFSEFLNIRNFLIELLSDKKWLFDRKIAVSKMEMLRVAKNVNIKTPNTLICSRKKDLELFFRKNNKSLITKSIGDVGFVKYKNVEFTLNTTKIEKIDEFKEVFSPSLFQEHIDKLIEIRTFYLDKKCYSMAIFSQSNEKTKLDFRNYDKDKPNRFVPYQLPKQLEERIVDFMEAINLNTGSLDFIKSKKNGDYYFLEVNPCGQFGMMSNPCNYNLHEKVADYIKKELYEGC
ncbi:grasp-with-spasm system ATP-grasp peptide maturase [Flavobacterium sp.]|uniref:grasp-with-spasm system ATP-grasp peptide maturase n=1 Tax=Flavobacterium sp. TaxID=239 RepID=UPI00261CBF9A|nr:grasp-with-spasm system ATP-grasp peptide maturase [Flavobacterium sp.]